MQLIQLTVAQTYGVTPQDLAVALWNSSPEQFKAVWLKFSELAKGDCHAPAEGERPDGFQRLDEFGSILGGPDHNPRQGSNARGVLRQLVDLAEFHAQVREREREGRRESTS